MNNNLISQSIQAFIIGSSWPIFIWYFVPVSTYGELVNFDYTSYTFVAPLFLGLLNVFGLLLAYNFEWSKLRRFVVTAIIGAILIASYITINQVYNYKTKREWLIRYTSLIMIYLFVYVMIAWSLENILETV